MNIHYIQHESYEEPGIISRWADEQGHSISGTHVYRNAAFPPQDTFDWLVIMGGSMNVYEEDRFPWLKEEKAFIRQTVDAGKTVLGICLGSQLLAAVLGGVVTKNPYKEIGWFPLSFYPRIRSHTLFSFLPENPVSFQWHGDTFSTLPAGAVPLAESAACGNQGFMFEDRIFAFQFHWECTQQDLEGVVKMCHDELAPAPYVQSGGDILGHPERARENNRWMKEFLSRLEGQNRAVQ
jgi:GMP synthase-like glutamine amidotransferase